MSQDRKVDKNISGKMGQRSMRISDYLVLGVKIILAVIATVILFRVFGLYSSYSYFLHVLVSGSGVDVMRAKPFAFILTMLSFALVPYALSYLVLGRGGWKLQILAACAGGIVFLWTYFVAENVYFDRKTGESLRCYARTPAGIRFSSTCDYDPEFGVKYQKITPELMHELRKGEHHPPHSNEPISKIFQDIEENSLLTRISEKDKMLWVWYRSLRESPDIASVGGVVRDGPRFGPDLSFHFYVERVHISQPYVLVSVGFSPWQNRDLTVRLYNTIPDVRDKYQHSHTPVYISLEGKGSFECSSFTFSCGFDLNSGEIRRMLFLLRPESVDDFLAGSVYIRGEMSTYSFEK